MFFSWIRPVPVPSMSSVGPQRTQSPQKIVYVSCNPDTLARDLDQITEMGYDVKKAVPVDLFPYTTGVETIVLMTRSKS